MIAFAIFIAALLLYLPLNGSIPITDPVEANYALTAKEMLLSGNWLSPQIYGQFWFDKPAMIYWLIAASYKIFGINEFAARFPAAIFSAGSVSFIYWFANKIYENRRVAIIAAVVLATSLEYWILARMVITDAVLLFFTSVAFGMFYLGLDGNNKKWQVAAYVFAGLAVLTKGPIGILLPGLTIFVYIIVTRRFELLRKLFIVPGLVIFLLTAAPWYMGMYSTHGKEFINTFFGLHNYLRATVSEHPKDNVIYYYLLLFPASILPWTGVFLRSLASRKSPHFSFLTVWIAVMIVFYSLMATKYPTYVFPALFPAALLIAWQLNNFKHFRSRQWLWLSVPVLLMLVAVVVGTKTLPGFNWMPLYLFAGLGALIILWLQLKGDRNNMPWATGAIVAILSMTIISQGLIPLAGGKSEKELVKVLPAQGAIVAAYGDYSTSADFYSGYVITKLENQINSVEPKKIWSGKYTMPVETVTSFAARTAGHPESYILVSRGSLPPLKNYSPVASSREFVLYKQQLKQ